MELYSTGQKNGIFTVVYKGLFGRKTVYKGVRDKIWFKVGSGRELPPYILTQLNAVTAWLSSNDIKIDRPIDSINPLDNNITFINQTLRFSDDCEGIRVPKKKPNPLDFC